MSESPLSTYAGPIAVIAGGLFAATHLAMFVTADRSDLVAMMSDPLFLVFNAAYAADLSAAADRPGRLLLAASRPGRDFSGRSPSASRATGTMALAGRHVV